MPPPPPPVFELPSSPHPTIRVVAATVAPPATRNLRRETPRSISFASICSTLTSPGTRLTSADLSSQGTMLVCKRISTRAPLSCDVDAANKSRTNRCLTSICKMQWLFHRLFDTSALASAVGGRRSLPDLTGASSPHGSTWLGQRLSHLVRLFRLDQPPRQIRHLNYSRTSRGFSGLTAR